MTGAGDKVRVTLVSNINHSVYAARALHRLGVLARYLGPVIVDSESRWPAVISPRLHATRAFDGVADLPLQRLVLAEAETRAVKALRLPKAQTLRFNSRVLDGLVAPRVGRPDIVHSHTAGLVRTAQRAKRAGAMLVADHRDVHPRDHDYVDPLLAGLEAEFALADWVLVNSQLSADSLANRGVPRRKLVHIPLGVDLDRYTPGHHDDRPARGATPARILFVGSVIRRKGVDTLIEALGRPQLRGAQLRVCGMVGDAALAELCAATENVTLVGPVVRERLVSEYRQADLLVLPSRTEAFGLVALEALACGTAVVVSSACGVASEVTDEVGRVVPAEDAAGLADAIAHVAVLGRAPGTAARARNAALVSSWGAYERRLMDWYQEVAIPAATDRERSL